jgi:hypothetical protein
MAKADNKKEKKVALPQSYTVSSMAAYLGMPESFQKRCKRNLELVFNMIEAGVSGRESTLGKIVKVTLKLNLQQKPEKGETQSQVKR